MQTGSVVVEMMDEVNSGHDIIKNLKRKRKKKAVAALSASFRLDGIFEPPCDRIYRPAAFFMQTIGLELISL